MMDEEIPRLIAGLGNPSKTYEAEASLKSMGDRAIPALASAVVRSYPWTRITAAKLLGQMRARSAADVLVTALSDEDVDLRIAALGALARLRVPHTREVLIGNLKDDVPAVRCAALKAVARVVGVRAINEIAALLHDSDIEVAVEACRRLTHLRSRKAAPILTAVLRGDLNRRLRRVAAEAIYYIREPALVDAARQMRDDPEIGTDVRHFLDLIDREKAQ